LPREVINSHLPAEIDAGLWHWFVDVVKDDMKSLGLSQKDVQFKNKWRRRVKGELANPGSPGKMADKMECLHN